MKRIYKRTNGCFIEMDAYLKSEVPKGALWFLALAIVFTVVNIASMIWKWV